MPTLPPLPAEPIPDPRTSRRRLRPPDQPTDDLIRAARAGDGAAAGELYRRTWPRARRVAVGYCRSDDADDAVAEGLSRALQRLQQLRDPVSAEAWLLRCVARAAIDQSRQQRRHRTLSSRATLVGQAATMASADEVALSSFERDAMAEAISELRPAQRRLLLLRYEAAAPLRTIAAAWQTPEGTLRRQCLEARREVGERFLYHQLRPVADDACARVTSLLCRQPYRPCAPRLRRHAALHLQRCSSCRDRQRELACLLHEFGHRSPPRY